MVQVGDKVIIFHTHSYNQSNPVWKVTHTSESGRQLTIENEGRIEQVSLRKGGYYTLSGVDGGKYTRIYFEGTEIFEQCAAKPINTKIEDNTTEREEEESEEVSSCSICENSISSKIMPYATLELFQALQVFVDSFEEGEPITSEKYQDAKNAIAYAKGKPRPFPERRRLAQTKEWLASLISLPLE